MPISLHPKASSLFLAVQLGKRPPMQLGFTSVPETPFGEQDCSGVPLEENALTDMTGVTKVTVETDTLIVRIIIVNNSKDLIM